VSPAGCAGSSLTSLCRAPRHPDLRRWGVLPLVYQHGGEGMGCLAQRHEYEGTSHFLVTASSAKIDFGEVNLQPTEGEAP